MTPDFLHPYVASLSELFRTDVDLFSDRACVHFEDGHRLEISFSDQSAACSIPLLRAHDGLPTSMLATLLTANAVGLGVTGATLRRRAHENYLELAAILPLASMSPKHFAEVAGRLLQAALQIDSRIAKATAVSDPDSFSWERLA